MTAERDALAALVAAWDSKAYRKEWGPRMTAAIDAARVVLAAQTEPSEPTNAEVDDAVIAAVKPWATGSGRDAVGMYRAIYRAGFAAAQPDNDQSGGASEQPAPQASTGPGAVASPDPATAPATPWPGASPNKRNDTAAPAQGEPPAPDDLVQRLRDVLRNWTNVTDDEQSVIREAADLIEQQAREIARVKLQLTSEITSALAERDALRLANIDAANLLAECSDMSVDIEKYRNEIAELKSERDAAQRAGVTTANYWKERAEQAEDQRERTRDVWATRAERAEAEREKLRECVRAADAMYAFADHTGGNPGCNRCDAADDFLAARAKVQP